MRLFSCFSRCHGQSSNPHTYVSQESNIQTGSLIYTVSSNYQESPTSRMLDFSTSLTPEGLPIFTQTFRRPKTPMPSRITSPKMVIIVNPDNTKYLGVQKQIRTMSTITQLMQQVCKRLSP
ncbi:AC4 protein [Rhynchosia golden mosaic Sinaloa virus]|uniref:AC4 protein n=1 Tax=Rhynchosia golden mosaic Sinaloa virus TaxID=1513519 RepID=Q208C5_9GEMI|nr:AC4 protein [Rhynchosia golden mosaic Sinaloa virus]ABD65394.1 AC4 protein [Rhynchosia golden mosaic Sinaloa virus]